MLVLTLSHSQDGNERAETSLRATVALMRQSAGIANYRCELQYEVGEPRAEAWLMDYPRFAEPVAIFAARAINQVLATCDVAALTPPVHCRLEIDVNWTPLHRVDWILPEEGVMLIAMRGWPVRAKASLWRTAQWALCIQQTGGTLLPPMPPPLRPPIYRHDDVPYCLLRDIPDEAREAYLKRHSLSTCPLVPAGKDACYPWDLYGFLGY